MPSGLLLVCHVAVGPDPGLLPDWEAAWKARVVGPFPAGGSGYVGVGSGPKVRTRGRAPCSDSLGEWTADRWAGPVLIVFLLPEYKFSARWTKVMGTAEWKAIRTRRW